MSTIASPSTRRTTGPAAERSRIIPKSTTVPGQPAETDYHVTPAAIGVALAWLAFFALAIEQALTTSYGEALQEVVMHLH